MQDFMLLLGSMSVQATVVMIVVFMIRKIFEKLHIFKKYMMYLWVLPFICLVCPWKITVPYGFWSAGPIQVVQEDRISQVIESGILGSPQKPQQEQTIGQNQSQEQQEIQLQSPMTEPIADSQEVDTKAVVLWTLAVIWLLGVGALIIYNGVCYFRLRKTLLCSMKIEENVWIGDDVATPMVVGLIRPQIYLPTGLPEEYKRYIIEHEKTHMKRFDPVCKMIAYGIVCIHWFNPFAWGAYKLFDKDLEMTCDEETIVKLGPEEGTAYAKALLESAKGAIFKERPVFAAPVAFEEGNVKARIQNIMKHKKAVTFVTVTALVISIVVAGGFMTRQEGKTEEKNRENIQGSEKETIENETEESEYPEYLTDIAEKSYNWDFPDKDNLTFADLEGKVLTYNSGVGGWASHITIHSDGTFEGFYTDGNTDTGFYYKDSEDRCEFSGKFIGMEKTGSYEYTLQFGNLEVKQEPETYDVVNGRRYNYFYPCGFVNKEGNVDVDKVILYLPGKDTREFPKDMETFWFRDYIKGNTLITYGLYNQNTDSGFVQWNDPELAFHEVYYSKKTVDTETVKKTDRTVEQIEKLRKRYRAAKAPSNVLTFADLEELDFVVQSPVNEQIGSTFLNILEDGTFEGSGCNGSFSSIEKVNDYEYVLKVKELHGAKIDWLVIDGIKQEISEPPGLDNLKEFRLYLPGTYWEDLPQELLDTFHDVWDYPMFLKECILYNTNGNELFIINKAF